MTTNYRNKLGNHIDFNEWRTELSDNNNNGSDEITITKGEYEIHVSKLFVGTSGSLFKVIVDCSEDCENYHGYHKSFQGKIKSDDDFQRVIDSINNDTAIMLDGKIIE